MSRSNKDEGKPTCYICGKIIKQNALYVGQGKHRHPSKCQPGSEEWMKSQVSKQSPMGRELRRINKVIEKRKGVS